MRNRISNVTMRAEFLEELAVSQFNKIVQGHCQRWCDEEVDDVEDVKEGKGDKKGLESEWFSAAFLRPPHFTA